MSLNQNLFISNKCNNSHILTTFIVFREFACSMIGGGESAILDGVTSLDSQIIFQPMETTPQEIFYQAIAFLHLFESPISS